LEKSGLPSGKYTEKSPIRQEFVGCNRDMAVKSYKFTAASSQEGKAGGYGERLGCGARLGEQALAATLPQVYARSTVFAVIHVNYPRLNGSASV
jgi:hypothetical protein